MITVFLRGGLGNQMFEYAAGLARSKKYHTEVALDTVGLADRTPRPHFTYRSYELGAFTLPQKFTALSRLAAALPVPVLWLGLDLTWLFLHHIFTGGHSVVFDRYQSESYFSDATDEVRAAFQFREPLAGDQATVAEQIKSGNSVSLHVRRGDYAAFKNVAGLMGKTNLEYYQAAVLYITSRVPDAHFFIFSDDIEWCKQNLGLQEGVTFVTPGKPAEDLQLMALCNHHIIANSTYSWWGAWLGEASRTIVVAPKTWYADGHDEGDITPSRWIKL